MPDPPNNYVCECAPIPQDTCGLMPMIVKPMLSTLQVLFANALNANALIANALNATGALCTADWVIIKSHFACFSFLEASALFFVQTNQFVLSNI